jgi:hypothetical protein
VIIPSKCQAEELFEAVQALKFRGMSWSIDGDRLTPPCNESRGYRGEPIDLARISHTLPAHITVVGIGLQRQPFVPRLAADLHAHALGGVSRRHSRLT